MWDGLGPDKMRDNNINLDFSFRADNPDRLRSRVQMLQLRGLSRGDQAE